MMIWGGIRFRAMNSISMPRLKRQLYRVQAKAIIEARNSTMITAGTTMTSVFRK